MGGSGGLSSPDAGEVFKNFVQNQWKIYNFLKNFQENFEIFSNFLKFYRIFGENLDKNLEKLKYAFAGGSGGRDPDASEFMEIWVEK